MSLRSLFWVALITPSLTAFGCNTSAQTKARPLPRSEEEIAQTAERLNANAAYEPGKKQLQLAIEVEVTDEGVKPLSSTIVLAPAKSNSAQAELRARATAGEEVVVNYVFPDPRIVEVEREGRQTLPRATTIIFVPLRANLSNLEVLPVAGMESIASKGGQIELNPIARSACEDRQELDVCKEILR